MKTEFLSETLVKKSLVEDSEINGATRATAGELILIQKHGCLTISYEK
jgi:hypothetical protein